MLGQARFARRRWYLVHILLLAVMLLSACGGAAPATAPEAAAPAAEEPAATESESASESAATSDGAYSESPMLAERVAAGELPPVEERLPLEPYVAGKDKLVVGLDLQTGKYGGIMRLPSYTVGTGKRAITVSSTNHLVRSGEIDVRGGKTGFISRSGYCLATLLRLPQTGQQVAVVVLGAKSNQGRFWETRHLFNWIGTHTQRLLGIAATEQSQQQQHQQQ